VRNWICVRVKFIDGIHQPMMPALKIVRPSHEGETRSKQIQFRTYAKIRIKGAMLDEIRAMDWVPRSLLSEEHLADNRPVPC